MSVDVLDALDRLGQSCPRCGERVEDLMLVRDLGLVLLPCRHVIEP